MRLYYIFESCALASHIVANEAGIPIEPIQVDRRTKKTTTGADFLAINPKGYVPMLELDNGEVLTENASLQHLAELKPESRLAPPNGTFACVRLQEALNYIATELHRGYGPLFNPSTPTAAREAAVKLDPSDFANPPGVYEKRRCTLGSPDCDEGAGFDSGLTCERTLRRDQNDVGRQKIRRTV